MVLRPLLHIAASRPAATTSLPRFTAESHPTATILLQLFTTASRPAATISPQLLTAASRPTATISPPLLTTASHPAATISPPLLTAASRPAATISPQLLTAASRPTATISPPLLTTASHPAATISPTLLTTASRPTATTPPQLPFDCSPNFTVRSSRIVTPPIWSVASRPRIHGKPNGFRDNTNAFTSATAPHAVTIRTCATPKHLHISSDIVSVPTSCLCHVVHQSSCISVLVHPLSTIALHSLPSTDSITLGSTPIREDANRLAAMPIRSCRFPGT